MAPQAIHLPHPDHLGLWLDSSMSLRPLFTALLCTLGLSTQAAAPPSDLARQVADKAALAVVQFQERAGGRLDYSEHSLQVLDEMLGEAARYRDQMPADDQQALVALMASYVLEVARRQHGGDYQWDAQAQQPVLVVGAPRVHLALMAHAKVQGRLAGDRADSLPFFYAGFAARVRSAAPGTRALYR